MKKKPQPKPRRWDLTLSLMLFVFGVIAVVMLTTAAIVFTLYKMGMLSSFLGQIAEQRPELLEQGPPEIPGGLFLLRNLLGLMAFSSLMALALTWFFGRRALDPLRKVIDATRRVAAGDFHVQVHLRGVGELKELSQSFNKMTRELHTIETLRSDFINTFSHELKTPLMSLRGFAKLLKEGSLPPEEQQEYLDIIIAESERLAALATNTLDLSKYEHIGILADKAPFRLDEQIRRTLALAEPQWSAKNLAVSVSLEEVTLVGREDLTQQIWVNLLDNAIKFTPPGGTIRIRLRKTGEGIRFTIRDDGAGMDEHALAHCFDKFFQSNPSASGTGSGLGLAIARRIVELSGGEITAESEAGKGSLFTVVL